MRQLTEEILQVRIGDAYKPELRAHQSRRVVLKAPHPPKFNVEVNSRCRNLQNFFRSKAHPCAKSTGLGVNLEIWGEGGDGGLRGCNDILQLAKFLPSTARNMTSISRWKHTPTDGYGLARACAWRPQLRQRDRSHARAQSQTYARVQGAALEQTQPNQTKPNQTKRNENKPNHTTSNQNKVNQTKPSRTEPNRTEPHRAEPSRTKPSRTESGQRWLQDGPKMARWRNCHSQRDRTKNIQIRLESCTSRVSPGL